MNKKENSWFFKKIFLLANLSISVNFEILFFILSNFEVNFPKLALFWRIESFTKTISIIKQVLFIEKQEFTTITLDLVKKFYVVYVFRFNSFILHIFLSLKIIIKTFKTEKIFTMILEKYKNFINIIFPNFAA